MASNKIFTFAQYSNQILTDQEYELDAQRVSGNQPGIARAPLVNKALKQSNLMAAALAQFGVQHTASNVHDAMSVEAITDIITEAVKQIASRYIVGKIELLPFRVAELPFGWYHANGASYLLNTAVGKALKALPNGYRTDWKIVEKNGQINLPNLYHTDGRAYFLRAGKTVGVVQEDAIRNITGSATFYGTESIGNNKGAFLQSSSAGTHANGGHGSSTKNFPKLVFNAFDSVPTAEENRPLNISLLPVVYLGV